MTGDDIETRLDQLESREAIRETLFAYIRATDRRDGDRLAGCFWPDATLRHGRFDGEIGDYLTFVERVTANILYASHQLTNISIELNGDQALVESYYAAHHRRVTDSGTEEDAFLEGRYLDLFERRSSQWKIARRRGLADHVAVTPANRPFAEWPEDQRSHAFPDDPYYGFLAQVRGQATQRS